MHGTRNVIDLCWNAFHAAKPDDQSEFIARIGRPDEFEAANAFQTMDRAFNKIAGRYLGIAALGMIVVTSLTSHGRRALAKKIREHLRPRALRDFANALTNGKDDEEAAEIINVERVEFLAEAVSVLTEEQRSTLGARIKEMDAANAGAHGGSDA